MKVVLRDEVTGFEGMLIKGKVYEAEPVLSFEMRNNQTPSLSKTIEFVLFNEQGYWVSYHSYNFVPAT